MGRAVDRAKGTDRAQWLAELSVALDQAQQLAWTLGVSEGSSAEARELYGQLDAVRIEVESLKQGQWSQLQPGFDPNWMGLLSWRASPPDGLD